MHIALQEVLDKSDAQSVSNLEREHKDFWLNKSARRFKKTRYTSNNHHRTGFEQTQKRIDDVRTVVVRLSNAIVPFDDEADVYLFDVPQNYDYLATARFFICEAVCNKEFIDTTKYVGTLIKGVTLSEEPTPFEPGGTVPTNPTPDIGDTGDVGDVLVPVGTPPGNIYFGNKDGLFTGDLIRPHAVANTVCRYVQGKEVQHDDIRTLLRDPFNKPRPHRPLYFFEGNQIYIYCNPTFVLAWMEITYLKKLIPMSSVTPLPVGFVDTSELPEHTHDEIVEMAVDMILETNSDPRYKTHQLELAKQE